MAIYAIKPAGSDQDPRYINAANRAQAVAFVARTSFECKVLRLRQVIELATVGATIERAIVDPEDPCQIELEETSDE
jgi:hypothetical protein